MREPELFTLARHKFSATSSAKWCLDCRKNQNRTEQRDAVVMVEGSGSGRYATRAVVNGSASDVSVGAKWVVASGTIPAVTRRAVLTLPYGDAVR